MGKENKSWPDSQIHDLAEIMDGILMERRTELIQEGKYPSWLDRYKELKREFLVDHPEYGKNNKNLPEAKIDELMLEAQR